MPVIIVFPAIRLLPEMVRLLANDFLTPAPLLPTAYCLLPTAYYTVYQHNEYL
jgi:hypothetical protein